jgi:hypothetical protein
MAPRTKKTKQAEVVQSCPQLNQQVAETPAAPASKTFKNSKRKNAEVTVKRLKKLQKNSSS